MEMKTNQMEPGVQAEKEGQKALTVTVAAPSPFVSFSLFFSPSGTNIASITAPAFPIISL